MKNLIFFILTLVCVSTCGYARKSAPSDFLNKENRALLMRLDSLLKQASKYDSSEYLNI